MYRSMLKRWPTVDIDQKRSTRSSMSCQNTGSASRIRQTQKQATKCKASDRLKPQTFNRRRFVQTLHKNYHKTIKRLFSSATSDYGSTFLSLKIFLRFNES